MSERLDQDDFSDLAGIDSLFRRDKARIEPAHETDLQFHTRASNGGDLGERCRPGTTTRKRYKR